MTPAPDTGRTAEEMRAQIRKAVVAAMPENIPLRGRMARSIMAAVIEPPLREAATARKGRDEAQTSLEECAALVSEYAAAAIPEGMEILAKDRDKWFDAAQAADAEAAHLRAENANLRDRVREAEKGGGSAA